MFAKTFIWAALTLSTTVGISSASSSNAYGLASQPRAKPYLQMPMQADGALPHLLSQTGAFTDTRNLQPSEALIPFDINVPFWSDGANKSR